MSASPPSGKSPAAPPSDAERPFDRRRLRARRARNPKPEPSFLDRLCGEGLADRLAPVTRDFETALAMGAASGAFLDEARQAKPQIHWHRMEADPHTDCDVTGDPEWLPFGETRFDLAVSALDLHWANDLPGALAQIRRALKPDGLFLAALLGGETLRELRSALIEAEAETTGGASLRVAPFAGLADLAGLLQRAGFALPVADRESVQVSYAHPLALLKDLQALGETGGLAGPRRPLLRRTLARACDLYTERFARADGRVLATFEILYMTGWAPHESQQKPLRPGSAKTRLADALGTVERPAGEKAGG